MNHQTTTHTPGQTAVETGVARGLLQRKCACGTHTIAGGTCETCRDENSAATLQRAALDAGAVNEVPLVVHEVLGAPGRPLDNDTRTFFESRFAHDFSGVRVHTDARAAESARGVNALAYTVGRSIVFGGGQYAPSTGAGRRLIAHELAHVVQQGAHDSAGGIARAPADESAGERNADAVADAVLAGRAVGPVLSVRQGVQRLPSPYIKKITVHLTPSQSAELEWEGTPPAGATGSDSFTVSTGKGYADPDDPAGTCTRTCCKDALTQCAPPWNQPGRVGACCTYYGNSFWTGTPVPEHNGWKWWTPIQPYYSQRGIALHQHTEVTGEPIGHGCVRMDEPNAKRIYDYSRGKRTNVTIDGRAAPVQCKPSQQCSAGASSGAGGAGGGAGGGGTTNATDEGDVGPVAEATQEPIPGLEGELT